jgi:DNA-binding MarR family transcriptional regulator
MSDAKEQAQQIIALMRENARLHSTVFSKRFRELSLTPEEARTLTYLRANEGGSQKRLADAMHVRPIVLTRLLSRLEAVGLVERQSYPTDRRAKILFLTTKGKVAARHIATINASLEQRLISDLTPQEMKDLALGLRVIQDTLQSMR